MTRYKGEEFIEKLNTRGASEALQVVLDFIQHPSAEEINEANMRGANGIRRQHFVRVNFPDSGEVIFLELDIAYKKPNTPIFLYVVEYDSDAEFELYRNITCQEIGGTYQSN